MRLRSDPDKSRASGSSPPRRNPFVKGQGAPLAKPLSSTAPGPHTSASAGPEDIRRSARPWYSSDWSLILGLAAVTFLAYRPCLNGDFVWDDDAWTLKLRGLHQNLAGLVQIWTNLTALQQYYPLTATTFWIDYHF